MLAEAGKEEHTVTLAADFSPARAALLVVDMQNAYCHPAGALAHAGANVDPMQAMIPNVKELIRVCRNARIPVMWTIMEQYSEDARRRSRTVPAHLQARRSLPVSLKGSWDAEIVEELRGEIAQADHIIRKQEYSAFYNTNLELLLRILGVSYLLISGVASNVCVESTVRDAFFRGFEVLLVENAIACSFPDLHEATLKNTRLWFGATITLEELSACLAPPKASIASATPAMPIFPTR